SSRAGRRALWVGLMLAAVALATTWWRRRPAPSPPAASSAIAAAGPKRLRAPDPRAQQRARIEGRITDSGGVAIARATVCGTPRSSALTEAETGAPTCVEAGADGRYRLAALLPARWTVEASALGHLPS